MFDSKHYFWHWSAVANLINSWAESDQMRIESNYHQNDQRLETGLNCRDLVTALKCQNNNCCQTFRVSWSRITRSCCKMANDVQCNVTKTVVLGNCPKLTIFSNVRRQQMLPSTLRPLYSYTVWHFLRQQVRIRELQRSISLFDCLRDALERSLKTWDCIIHLFASQKALREISNETLQKTSSKLAQRRRLGTRCVRRSFILQAPVGNFPFALVIQIIFLSVFSRILWLG